MSKKALKGTAIGCFALCAVLLFVAWERYNTNANNVQAMNQMMGQGPFEMLGVEGEMEPATPTATKYALLFAALSGVGGVVCVVLASNKAD